MEKLEPEKHRQGRRGSSGAQPRLAGDAVILDLAMKKENYSISLYQALYDFVERQESKALLKNLVKEEQGHLNLLREVMVTGNFGKLGVADDAESLEITDYMIQKDLGKSVGPEEIVKLAIRREEESEEFYLSRVNFLQDKRLKQLYQKLAREEKGHRKQLLKGYDDLIIMHKA